VWYLPPDLVSAGRQWVDFPLEDRAHEDENSLARLRPSGTGFEEPHDVMEGLFQPVQFVLKELVSDHILVIGEFDSFLDGVLSPGR